MACRHNPLLNLAKRGAARYSAHRRATRKPITHNLLICLLHHLRQYSSLCPQDRRMLAAAFSLAFHGFLRVGEYTVPSLHRFNPSHHATVHDIIWHKHHPSFTIKRSKTDQLGRGTSISIQKSSRPSTFCPYRTINRYVTRLPSIDPCTTPLFCFRDGTPLSRSACHKFLSHLLSQAGYRASEYNTHSFRIGAATSAAMAGVPGRVIKRLGRWRSRAVNLYIRPMLHSSVW